MTVTAPTPPVVERLEVAWLDPRQLAEHPWNVRGDVGDITGLTASIAAQGVLEPLVVVPIDAGGHQLVAGARRRAAAIAAELELVPCIVRRDLAGVDDADVAEQVAAMLAENVHRGSLTATEEARGVKLMLELGVPISKIPKRTGLPAKRVKLAVGVSRLDDDTAAAVDLAQLDLDQAAAVALFADEPTAAAKLITAAERGPGEFAHALERQKQARDVQQKYLARRAKLEQAGRTIVENLSTYEGRTNRTLTSLRQGAGPLTDEEHATCPGSAVYLALQWGQLDEREVCTDYVANGHSDPYSSSTSSKPETEEEKEAAKAERRKVIENNKLMAAANTVRREWIREYLARKTAPKTVLRFAVETIAIEPSTFNAWVDGNAAYGDKDAPEALGLQAPARPWSTSQAERRVTLTSGEQVPDARLPLQLLGHIAGAIEQGIARDSWRKSDNRRDHLVRWLSFLAGEGYTLSDVEQQIVDGAK